MIHRELQCRTKTAALVLSSTEKRYCDIITRSDFWESDKRWGTCRRCHTEQPGDLVDRLCTVVFDKWVSRDNSRTDAKSWSASVRSTAWSQSLCWDFGWGNVAGELDEAKTA
jgi:hypothetical protein